MATNIGRCLQRPGPTMQTPKEAGSPGPKDSPSQYDFTQPNPYADVILLVEDTKLYTSRYTLTSVSKTFVDFFSADAEADRGVTRIPLPGDSPKDIVRILAWMTPCVRLPVTDKECLRLVHVAFKYGIAQLLQECEKGIVRLFAGKPLDDNARLDLLLMAQNYNLKELKGWAVEHFSSIKFDKVRKLKRFSEINKDTMLAIYEQRVLLLEELMEEAKCTDDDINLVVEDHIIPTSRAILSAASPVFRAMLSHSFREADQKDIPLPGKIFEEVEFMVDFISLPDTPPLTGSLLAGVVHMSDEYQIEKMKAYCERFMLDTLVDKSRTNDDTLFYFLLSQQYSIPRVMEHTSELLAGLTTKELEGLPDYEEADMYKVFRKRLMLLEGEHEAYTQANTENQ